MKLSMQSPFLGDAGPDADVVMSCRVRMARNLAGFPFVARASTTQQAEIVKLAQRVLLESTSDEDDRGWGNMMWVDLHCASDQDRALLMERHLISRNLAQASHPRGVAIADAESLSIMVNEEDHLRMQVLMPGLQLEEVYRRLDMVDDAVECRLDYAFSERWGYLTACPTNVGTGLRLSVMLHLPGLKLTKEIEKVRRSAKDLNLAVRGYYGEGSESAGDFYQISNQITLGREEGELLNDFQVSILPQIIDYERIARQMLLDDSRRRLCDRVFRAIAVLQHARLIGIEEAMRHLSKVRLGIHVGLLNDVPIHNVNRLFLLAQNAHLRLHHDDPDLEGEDLLAARAELIRTALS